MSTADSTTPCATRHPAHDALLANRSTSVTLFGRPDVERDGGRQAAGKAERRERERPHQRVARDERGDRHHHERPPGEIGEEPDAEADAVQERCDPEREERPPPVRDLAPELWDGDPGPEDLGQIERRRGRDDRPTDIPRRVEEHAEPCEHRAERRGGERRPCRMQREQADPPPSPAPWTTGVMVSTIEKPQGPKSEVIPATTDAATTASASGRSPRQHRTFRSRYVMQKTRRPRGQ